MRPTIVPEFYMKAQEPGRAGFVPSDDEGLVELWQLWCRMAEGEDARRATLSDLDAAGFMKKEKECRKPKKTASSKRR